MTNAELIKKLQAEPPDQTVEYHDSRYASTKYGFDVDSVRTIVNEGGKAVTSIS